MITVDVSLLPAALPGADLVDPIVVAVDVLRASSTIIVAFENEVSEIYPVETLDDARKLAQLHPGSLLVGEQSSLKPEDFDFDNSPLSVYRSEDLQGKPLVMCTTNGTVLLKRLEAMGFEKIYIGSFLNLVALVDFLAEQKRDILISCAGDHGQVSIEDIGFAGAVIQRLEDKNISLDLTDAALVAGSVWRNFDEDVADLFSQSAHASTLAHLGRLDDLSFISQMTFRQIPVFQAKTAVIEPFLPAEVTGSLDE